MKWLITFLVILFLFLQFRLWFANNGIAETWNLHQTIKAETKQNQELQKRNQTLAAEVKDLKTGTAAIEERARSELGMVMPGETFYQIIDIPGAHNSFSNQNLNNDSLINRKLAKNAKSTK